MKFRLRIDGEDQSRIQEFCSGYPEYVLVSHVLPHGNPHFHAYINAPMVMSDQAFRMRVKRCFNPQSRSDYSVKVCDQDKQDEYIQYLFNTKHGNVARLVSYQYDDDMLATAQKGAQEVTDDFKQRQKSRKSKGPTIYDLAEEVNQNVSESTMSIKDYTECAIKVLHSHRKTCEPNMLIKLVSTARSFKDKDFLVKKVQFYFQEN